MIAVTLRTDGPKAHYLVHIATLEPPPPPKCNAIVVWVMITHHIRSGY